MEERQRRLSKQSPPRTASERVFGLDLSFQGLRSIAPSIFLLTTIRELILNNNELEKIPKDICKLRSLEKLNVSHNKLRGIPPELGKTVSLKELHLNDNFITNVPMELGSLYNLEILNLSNNPLVVPFSSLSKDKSLIHFCRENNTAYGPPADRAWEDTVLKKDTSMETITVGSLNMLCNFYAAKCTYAPSWVTNPELRKESLLQSIVSYNVDILALQEIETYSYLEYYRDQLGLRLDYDGVFYPRGRSQTLSDKRAVDGCAIFWKRSKYRLVEQVNVDFFQKIVTDIRFSLNQDILSRNARKDNVALITVLEKPENTQIIVVNTHIFWDPEYPDVKLFQVILLIEEIEKVKQKYKNTPIVLMGDFNSLRDSSVYSLIVERKTDGVDFGLYDYSPFNSGYRHAIRLYDAYQGQDLGFTNFTPTFRDTIDYIFFGDNLMLTGVLSPIEEEYAESCVGLPNIHFPSDHIFIGARLGLKSSTKKSEKFK